MKVYTILNDGQVLPASEAIVEAIEQEEVVGSRGRFMRALERR